jgi:hypothetical protein
MWRLQYSKSSIDPLLFLCRFLCRLIRTRHKPRGKHAEHFRMKDFPCTSPKASWSHPLNRMPTCPQSFENLDRTLVLRFVSSKQAPHLAVLPFENPHVDMKRVCRSCRNNFTTWIQYKWQNLHWSWRRQRLEGTISVQVMSTNRSIQIATEHDRGIAKGHGCNGHRMRLFQSHKAESNGCIT